MVMKLSQEFETARKKFADAVTSGADMDVQNELYNDMLEAMFEESKKVARNEVETAIATTPAEAGMTARERAFFNQVKKSAPEGIEEHFPEETVDRIFEDLMKKHPLLEHIGLRNAGIRLKFYTSENAGKAVWGKINGEIKGQLEQSFQDDKAIQNKLTAFVVLPKDTEKFSPAWLMTFVNLQIQEAFAAALEEAFLNGDGADKPIGLSRKLTGTSAPEGTTYPEKAAQSTILTFADTKTVVKELTTVYKHHSTKENGEPVAVEGNVVMVVNPADAWDVKKQYTSLNAQGFYVTAMPYNLIVVESIYQTKGKVTTFVKGRYDAFVAGGLEINKYTETFGLEDANLYTAKQFAYGKARDEKAAAVWTLQVPDAIPGA